MSSFTGLNTMVRGVYINQLALNTVGHNIVNADTEGYSRQNVNPVATAPQYENGYAVGTGADAATITRARDVYADVQYRNENARANYYETMAKNYDKIESIFNDSNDSGIQNSMEEFYKAWVDLSTKASDSAARTAVVEKGKNMTNSFFSASEQLREQIEDKYADIEVHVHDINQMLEDIAHINKIIVAKEGDKQTIANDLRDQRDLLVDRLSGYLNIAVHENEVGAYQVSSNGVALVSGTDRIHLEFSGGIDSAKYGIDYGVVDHAILVKESDVVFIPENGMLKADLDAIDKCKLYLDDLSNMAAYMLTALNDQHAQGYDLEGNYGRNFYGVTGEHYEYFYDEGNLYGYVKVLDDDGNYKKDRTGKEIVLTGVEIINKMSVNIDFDVTGGYQYIAAATAYDDSQDYNGDTDMSEHEIDWAGRTGDGTNAVYVSELFNLNYLSISSAGRANAKVISKYADKYSTITAIGANSFNAYYKSAMAELGVDAGAMDTNIEQQDVIMDQILNWRDSTAGVDWNEELANMIKYQKGFGACSRCLSAMDECLERLVNSTGVVGR